MSTAYEDLLPPGGTAPPPVRSWAAPRVLAALAAMVIGAVWLVTSVGPSRPGASSAEAGFARGMSVRSLAVAIARNQRIEIKEYQSARQRLGL
jgi:hypothetical protein